MFEEITKNSINEYTYRSHRHTPCKSTFEVADHRAWPSLEFWGNWFPTQEHTLTAFSLPPKRVFEVMWKGPFTLFLECIYLAFDFYDPSPPFRLLMIFVHLNIHPFLEEEWLCMFTSLKKQNKQIISVKLGHLIITHPRERELMAFFFNHEARNPAKTCCSCLPLLATITIPGQWTIKN